MPNELLVSHDTYLSAGIHIGAKFRTKFMQSYIYKIRPDGLAVLDVQKIDEKLRIASKFISRFDPAKIFVVCRRENGHKAVQMFAKLTGARAITQRYLPGTMTNPIYVGRFFEPELLIVCDPWPSKQAIKDALKIGIPIIALCDTNNTTRNIDLVIPCNNKGKKSLGLIFWIIAREFLKLKGKIKSYKEFKYSLEDFS
jgi:small subunit ribosomal protein S2